MSDTSSTVIAKEINALISGYHGDPFHILGPHEVDNGIAIRAFLPRAKEVSIVTGGQTIAMPCIDDAGFYEILLADPPAPLQYQFLVETFDGNTELHEDVYRFPPQISQQDRYLHGEGTLLQLYETVGAHLHQVEGHQGVRFAVWAPGALRVSVIGDFNHWDGRCHPMRAHASNGLWELFIPGLKEGDLYKYEIKTRYKDYTVAKSDPVGFAGQMRPQTASVVWDVDKYAWQDNAWINERPRKQALDQPMSVYEVHLGSWRLKDGWEWLTYQELIETLIPYVKEMGYTHIELLPVSEHPFDGSWGYQVTGYFAPTRRFGTPDEFKAFVDACHQADIGVILDWVPAHFPTDQHGLGFFDGTHLYEHEDPRQGAHPDWGTYIFNYGRNEIRQFLISNALFWIEKYHIDGLRVDAVASMLYLDFSRKQGEWLPNRYGGRENIEALAFIREFNKQVHDCYPGVLTIAEESTSWPGVTKPIEEDGLGFDMKWNMGWMHDTLQYISNETIHRAYHQGTLTFSLLYAFSENFMLPLSHDEVVHLKKSMLDKMPGDVWQRFANLRLLYGYQWSHPGKKLLFMGGEFGQWREWSEERELDWYLLEEDEKHKGLQQFMKTINYFYRQERPLYELDNSWEGFSWIDIRDSQRSILAYTRIAPSTNEKILVVCNFTPVVRYNYRLGVPEPGEYQEILNSDAEQFGGSNILNEGSLQSEQVNWHDQDTSIQMTLPPLGIVYLKKA
ncbi:MAG: 1,4-alpha-glucan branching protein GlgB [Chloroflexi bacterium]|nr:1,4-alpha-glucan branching protein GlgB [Chloroflexota bacterium]